MEFNRERHRMAGLVLTWDVVEKNIELILEKVKKDEILKEGLINLFKTNIRRYLDLMDAWERKNFTEYYRKWGK